MKMKTLQLSMTQLSAVVPFVDSKFAVSKPCKQMLCRSDLRYYFYDRSGMSIIAKFCRSKLHKSPPLRFADSKIAYK